MSKILLCGAVQGQWELLFERVRKLNAAAKDQPFDALVCVSRCFPLPSDYVTGGGKNVPLLTYFLPAHESARSWQDDAVQTKLFDTLSAVKGSSEPLEVGDGFYCLAGAGVATIAGLKVVYVSGIEAVDPEQGKGTLLTYSKASVDELMQQHFADGKVRGDVDFLVTAEYPTSFQLLLPEQQLAHGLQAMRGKCSSQRDRAAYISKVSHYESWGDGTRGDVFYQRLPYVSEVVGTGCKRVTRLIGLSGVNTIKDKTRKYLHALQVVPFAKQITEESQHVDIPAGTTKNPYLHALVDEAISRNRESDAEEKKDRTCCDWRSLCPTDRAAIRKSGDGTQFFYDQRLAAKGQRKGGLLLNHKPQQQRSNRSAVPDRTGVLVLSVDANVGAAFNCEHRSKETYLAMPKGAKCEDHVLIVPYCAQAPR
uniref:Uncharacterized protein n=1 Tax=Peronospora matthiolae TaxID=2874970 RepID=A0AAV1UIL0_9STRA